MALNGIKFILKEFFCIIFVGIGAAKNKHNCFIMSSDGEVLYDVFTIENNKAGFDKLYEKITSVPDDMAI